MVKKELIKEYYIDGLVTIASIQKNITSILEELLQEHDINEWSYKIDILKVIVVQK